MAGSEIKQIQNLLLWAREHRIIIHEVKLGDLAMSCTDVELQFPPKRDGDDDVDRTAPRPANIYQEHADRVGMPKEAEGGDN